MGLLDFFKKLKNDIIDPLDTSKKGNGSDTESKWATPKKEEERSTQNNFRDTQVKPDTYPDSNEAQLTEQEEYVAHDAPEVPLREDIPLEVPEDLPLTEIVENPSTTQKDKEALLQQALEEEQALLEEQLALRAERLKQEELKEQEINGANEPQINTDDQGQNPSYLGNLEHTALIDQLLRVPREERDDEWVGQFLSHVATASFVCGEPQVIQGPDNFPYFQIFIPEANKPFQCYVLEHMLDDFLLENGLGVALEPKDGQVEWILTYGDLLHYSVHRTFAIPNDHVFGKGKEGDEVIQQDEQVLVGAPSEYILPVPARAVIKSFLNAQGVAEPKVCIIDRSQYGKGQDLVFNLVPEQFESQVHYRAVMQALGWFIPRYYSYIGAQERAFDGHFLPL